MSIAKIASKESVELAKDDGAEQKGVSAARETCCTITLSMLLLLSALA